MSNTIDVNPSHETPCEKDDRINLTIMKLSVDRTRLRKEVSEQRKSMKELRKLIIFWKKKSNTLSINFTESSAMSQHRIKKLEKQVKTLIGQNQSLIKKNQSLTDQNKSFSECFDFTTDIDTVVPDDSQPNKVEDIEKNKPVESSEKPKKRKRKTSVRKSVRNKK